jgi:hypothetical protein
MEGIYLIQDLAIVLLAAGIAVAAGRSRERHRPIRPMDL